MKLKTKNKLKAMVAKSKREEIKKVMLTYNWNAVKFTTVRIDGNTFASIRERGNRWEPNTVRTMIKHVAENNRVSFKGKLAIFAIITVVDSKATDKLKQDQELAYGKYFGTYVSSKQLTVFI